MLEKYMISGLTLSFWFVGQRFAATLLPRLFGTNPRYHYVTFNFYIVLKYVAQISFLTAKPKTSELSCHNYPYHSWIPFEGKYTTGPLG